MSDAKKGKINPGFANNPQENKWREYDRIVKMISDKESKPWDEADISQPFSTLPNITFRYVALSDMVSFTRWCIKELGFTEIKTVAFSTAAAEPAIYVRLDMPGRYVTVGRTPDLTIWTEPIPDPDVAAEMLGILAVNFGYEKTPSCGGGENPQTTKTTEEGSTNG